MYVIPIPRNLKIRKRIVTKRLIKLSLREHKLQSSNLKMDEWKIETLNMMKNSK